MKIFEKLAQLADDLDKSGLISEASEVDGIIKSLAVDWGKIDEHFKGKLNKNISPTHIQNIKNLRIELGLNAEPAVFDRDVANALRLNYPGIWRPRSGQKAADVLSAVRNTKARTMDFAGQPGVFGPGGITIEDQKPGMDFTGQPGVFTPDGVSVEELSGDVGTPVKGPAMPATKIPSVDLGAKPDAKLPPQKDWPEEWK